MDKLNTEIEQFINKKNNNQKENVVEYSKISQRKNSILSPIKRRNNCSFKVNFEGYLN